MLFRLIALSLPLPFALALVIGAICAQPYQPGDARALLDAPALGIQPGITSLLQLETIARGHPWIASARFSRGMEIDSGYLQWSWSGAQPGYIDAAREGALWVQAGRVQWVDIPTIIPFGDVWLTLPPPLETTVYAMATSPRRAQFHAHYEEGLVRVRTELACPLRAAAFWHAPVIVRFQAGAQTMAEGVGGRGLPTWGVC
jgi:hypothetical protein